MPILETERLILRPLELSDIPQLVPLIGAREVAATTLRIPHPYTEQHAREFITLLQTPPAQQAPIAGQAITRKQDGQLIGGIGLQVDDAHKRAELGYWIGVPFWANGYATEAARAMLAHGFAIQQLHRVFASHFAGNTASGRVLKKIGMRHEGCQRDHILKGGKFLDSELYGILRSEWEQ
jgi:[ribosomal protein S5]-alanine N-acetyltransferase